MRRKHIYLFCLTLLILGCLTVKVQFVGVVGAEEPVAHYKFEGNLEDETGNYGQAQIIGEEIGPSVGEVTDKTGKEYGSINFTDGWQGQAANFDGSSGLLLPEDLISDDTYTVTLWAKPEEINSLSPLFFGGYGDQENISLVPNGPIGDTMVWSKAAWYYANTEMTIPKKQWTHLAFSVDKGEISVYINGKEMYNDTDFPELFAGLSEVVFALGVDWWNSPYKGQIDELRIYDSVVAAKRVAEMAEGAPEIGQEEEPEFGEVGVHDPMVTEDNGTFYVFGSHLASAKSEDLLDWEQISSRVAKNNALIPDPKEELSQVLDWAQTDTLWAGSVIKLDDEQYHFYYSACVGDAPRSALGLAVADDIEGPYEHQEILLKSGMNGKSEDGKNYNANIHPNVVDPHVFYDQQGALWMVYGSYSGGIFIMEMDSETGLPLPEQGYGKKLLGGNHSRIEAPYILYNPETDYYYLFLSFGGLGSDGGYNIRVARSENPDGPYYDSQGNEMIEAQGPEGTFFEDQAIEPYGAKLIGNFEFAESGVGYVSPGHNSAYYDEETGKMYAFFHTRFPRRGERHNLRVHQMVMNSEGWPVIMPHRYAGESVESYTENEITGDYQYINHGTEITAEIRESVEISLKEDGSIAGAVEGTWEKTGDYTVDIEIEGDLYHGVVLKQWDDGLEEYVMTFSALSEKGVTIWGSQVVK